MSYKIAMIVSNPFVNDVRVLKEAKTLVNNGYDVTVFAWDRECKYPKQEIKQGISIQRIHVRSTYGNVILQALVLPIFILKVLLHSRKSNFSIVHCHDLETLPLGLLMKKLYGCQVIFDAHEHKYLAFSSMLPACFNIWIGNIVERLTAKRADYVLTVDNFQLKKYEKMGIENVSLIGNFVDLEIKNLDIISHQKSEIFIGRIGTMYDVIEVNLIIDAWTILRTEYPSINLLLAGSPHYDPVPIIRKIQDISYNDAEFIPEYHYTDLAKLYAKLSVFIMPYTSSFCKQAYGRNGLAGSGVTPTKLFEAMYFGIPIVASNIGDVGNILREENCGIVLDENNAEAIAKAISLLISEPELRREMGKNGQKAIRTKYNWGISAAKLLSVYESLLIMYKR